jgi:radical SAM-linked protein
MVSTIITETTARQRVRIRFCKQGDLRLIGHRDLARLMERLFRRASLPLGMSEGFHPKPRMSFPSALSVGIEGLDEILELELARHMDAETIRDRLEQNRVEGLTFRSVELLDHGGKKSKARLRRIHYEIPIPAEQADEISSRIARLLACETFEVERPRGKGSIDLIAFLDSLRLEENRLVFAFRVTEAANPGPRDLLTALELTELESRGYGLVRTKVEIDSPESK